ncbi:MAG TPA: right-handed parallel beta-helix repeat-containing protein [Candidatus Thermoplasmatota archaeon]|nr:right-handed parallel beta-helix repeat-containing protein [Candidatus Thermoplasmatota archaeon]
MQRLRTILVVILLAGLMSGSVPTAAGTPFDAGPILFDGEEAFRGPVGRALGVTGSGTASDPFVISGLSIPVPVAPSWVPNLGSAGVITIRHSAAHVRIVDNEFYGVSIEPGTPMKMSPPAVLLVASSHVVVENNTFRGIGGTYGAVAVLNSEDIQVLRNTFEDAFRLSVALDSSSATVEDNAFRMIPMGSGTGIMFHKPLPGSRIAGNRMTSAGAFENVGIVVFDASDAIVIRDNLLGNIFLGLRVVGSDSRPPALIRNNTVEASHCAMIDGRARLEANAFVGCSYGLEANVADIAANNTVNGFRMLSVRDAPTALIENEGIGWLRIINVRHVTLRNIHNEVKIAEATIEGADQVLVDNVTMRIVKGLNIKADTVRISNAVLRGEHSMGFGGLRIVSRILEVEDVAAYGTPTALSWASRSGGTATVTGSTFTGGISGLILGGDGCSQVTVTNSSSTAGASALLECSNTVVRNTSILGFLLAIDETVVDARYNWWGHASGPYHDNNPGGQGSRAIGNVLFKPWRISPP